MISMGKSASRDSGSAKAVYAQLNMIEFCCSCGRDITCARKEEEEAGSLEVCFLITRGAWSLLDIPEEQNVYKALDQTLDFIPRGGACETSQLQHAMHEDIN